MNDQAKQPKGESPFLLPKFRYPRLIAILSITILTLLVIDFGLYHLDPLGIVSSVHGNHSFHAVMQPDPTGYRLATGTHRFHDYTATILADGSRAIPATNGNAECTLATIGDSMTFGQGVNDADTWVNLLAEQYPDVHFANPSRPDYSAVNVTALKQAYPADGYIWLLIYNDAIEPYVYSGVQPAYPYPPATTLYRAWFVNQFRGAATQGTRQTDMQAYWQAVNTIADDNVLIAGFAEDELAMTTAMQYPVILLPAYTAFVSPVDRHPNAEGHRQIADSLLPYLTPFIEMVCNG
jgi:hypothetical protein